VAHGYTVAEAVDRIKSAPGMDKAITAALREKEFAPILGAMVMQARTPKRDVMMTITFVRGGD